MSSPILSTVQVGEISGSHGDEYEDSHIHNIQVADKRD
jgi:hypothetical protein